MPKKKIYVPKPYESSGCSGDISANIYKSMILSPAWQELTAQQRDLYLTCKLQAYGEKRKPIAEDPLSFTMNKGKWADLYHLYDRNNGRGFQRDLTALIRLGFISCVSCGAISRTKSIYRFSSKWRLYGTDRFCIEPGELTLAMLRRMRSEKESPVAKLS